MRQLYYREPQLVGSGIEDLKEWALEGNSKLPYLPDGNSRGAGEDTPLTNRAYDGMQ